MKKCKVIDCNNYKKYLPKGYCYKHYMQLRLHGRILERTRFDKNEIIKHKNYYEICIYKGVRKQKIIAKIKIDKDDINKIKQYRWYLDGGGYAVNKSSKKILFLHRLVLGSKKGFITDHINRNKLDNRKKNLRFVNYHQNSMNRMGNKNIYFHRGKWKAMIGFNGKQKYLGRFINKKDAIKARNKAELIYWNF